MAEEIIVLNTGNNSIVLSDVNNSVDYTITPATTRAIPVVFSANPTNIQEWDLALGQNGACEFHQGYLVGNAAPVAGKKATLLLSVRELSGGNHLAVKAHGRPKKRRNGTEVDALLRKGKRKVAVTRTGSGRIRTAAYHRGSTTIDIRK